LTLTVVLRHSGSIFKQAYNKQSKKIREEELKRNTRLDASACEGLSIYCGCGIKDVSVEHLKILIEFMNS